ncbi:hypothetical protein T06_15973 [Trichinella sp. T6]|nr:hypothetical protein T06_15973 [Trichinella sp. T6]
MKMFMLAKTMEKGSTDQREDLLEILSFLLHECTLNNNYINNFQNLLEMLILNYTIITLFNATIAAFSRILPSFPDAPAK